MHQLTLLEPTCNIQQACCFRSRAIAGVLDSVQLTDIQDDNGTNFLQAAAEAGYAPSQNATTVIESARAKTANIDFFLELHIEQGLLPIESCAIFQHWVTMESPGPGNLVA
jgi:hypothetical protein